MKKRLDLETLKSIVEIVENGTRVASETARIADSGISMPNIPMRTMGGMTNEKNV